MSSLLRLLASASRARMLASRLGWKPRREKKQRSAYYRDLWCRAAQELGADVVAQGDVLCITRAGTTARVYQNYTDLDGPVALRAAGDKPLVHQTLRAHGVPTPDHLVFSVADMRPAINFMRSHDKSVVKPAAGTGAGAGVTTGVHTNLQLRRASILAAAHGPNLLIEEQVAGRNVRLLFLDGRLLDAVERRPPSVVGDGQSTVERLVRLENHDRQQRGSQAAQVFLRRDLDMQRTLAEQGLSWRKVPVNQQVVRLKTVINDNAADDNVSVKRLLSKELVDTGRRAARAMRLRLAGVDIVTPDLTVDLDVAKGVVLEVNSVPGLYIHHAGAGNSVAVPILEACLEREAGIAKSFSNS